VVRWLQSSGESSLSAGTVRRRGRPSLCAYLVMGADEYSVAGMHTSGWEQLTAASGAGWDGVDGAASNGLPSLLPPGFLFE
jgi:hypothetical protein